VPGLFTDRAASSLCGRPAAPAGMTSLSSGAALRHRAGRDRLQSCRQRARKGQRHRQASHLLRPMQSHAIGRMGSPSVLPPARAKVPAAPAGVTSLAAVAEPCHRAGCGHLQRRRQRVRKGPAEPAGLTSLTCGATPRHRAGRDRLQCCRQRVRKNQQHRQASHLLRPMQSHAIMPDGVTYSAATSACKGASSTSKHYVSCGRCSAMPLRRWWSPTVLSPARAKVPEAQAGLASFGRC